MKKQIITFFAVFFCILQFANAIEDFDDENCVPIINVSIENIGFGKQPRANLEVTSPINNTITECAFLLFNEWKEYPNKIVQNGKIRPNETYYKGYIDLIEMNEEGDFSFGIFCYDIEGYEGENDRDVFSIRKPEEPVAESKPNSKPSANNVAVRPSNPTEEDALECDYIYSDPENDIKTKVSYMWFRNGVQEWYNSKRIPTGRAGESWRCAVQVSDKYGKSEWAFSEYVIISGEEEKEEPINETLEEHANITIPVSFEITEDNKTTENTTETIGLSIVEENKRFPYAYILLTIPLLAVAIFSLRMMKKRKFELAKKAYFDHLDNQNNQVIVEEQNGKKQPEETGIEPVKAGAAKQAASD